MKRNGFTLIEVCIVIGIILILASIFISTIADAHRASERDARVKEIINLIARKGLDTKEPIYLKNGWFYVNNTRTNVNDFLASLIHETDGDKKQNLIALFPVLNDDFGNQEDSSIILEASHQLGTSSGYFVYTSSIHDPR